MEKMKRTITAEEEINALFKRKDEVKVTFSDGTTAIIDGYFCRDLEELIEEEGDWLTEEEKAEWLERGQVIECWLYDEDNTPIDGQCDILILGDNVAEALEGAYYCGDIVDVS